MTNDQLLSLANQRLLLPTNFPGAYLSLGVPHANLGCRVGRALRCLTKLGCLSDGFAVERSPEHDIDWGTEFMAAILVAQACQLAELFKGAATFLPFVLNGQFPAVRVMADADCWLSAMLDAWAIVSPTNAMVQTLRCKLAGAWFPPPPKPPLFVLKFKPQN